MYDSIKTLVEWTGPYKRRLYIGYLFSFINSIFVAMPIVLASYGMNLVIMDYRGLQQISTSDIVYVLAEIIGLVLGRFLFSYLRAICQDSIAYEQTSKTRIDIGDILKRVSLGFFSKNSTGEISTSVTTDLSYFEMYSMKMLDTVVNGYISAAVMILTLLFFSPIVALIAVVGIVLSAFALRVLSLKSKASSPIHQKAQDDMVASVIEYIRGIAVVKAFNRQGIAAQGVNRTFESHKDINIKIEREYVTFNGVHRMILRTASTIIILTCGIMSLQGDIPLFVMLMLFMFSFVIFAKVEEINNAVHVFRILDTVKEKMDKILDASFIDSDGKDIELKSHDVELDKVSFSYDEKTIIDDISFKVPQQSVTAIVGPSGSGKTTITRLMARFYDVDEGKVIVGGHDVKDLTCDSLLKNFSMVFQNVYLFRDTIRNNIKFGNPEATDEEMIEAAKAANCHSFIMDFPDGYDTVIGDGGSSLSGGEKQRISIARAILKDAPIVILDEATASVDPENEKLIQEAISNLISEKTLIVIAHRLATVQNADQILVIDNGKVAESGTHQELLVKKGLYKKFWDIRSDAESWQIH